MIILSICTIIYLCNVVLNRLDEISSRPRLFNMDDKGGTGGRKHI